MDWSKPCWHVKENEQLKPTLVLQIRGFDLLHPNSCLIDCEDFRNKISKIYSAVCDEMERLNSPISFIVDCQFASIKLELGIYNSNL
jgi:hypothetical protein